MARTRARAFATGRLARHPAWLALIGALVGGATLAAAWLVNPAAALYTFAGAFFYGVVYTVWLKRRTAMNIVIGGLAGSFAVLAGAAAASPQSRVIPDRAALERRVDALARRYEGEPVPRPAHWGGLRVAPDRFEFWQHRESRMHDRIAYCRDTTRSSGWRIERIAP